MSEREQGSRARDHDAAAAPAADEGDLTRSRASTGRPTPTRFRDLAPSGPPFAAFPFDWRRPGYARELVSNDFHAFVFHEGGASLAWHGRTLDVVGGDVHFVRASSPHRVFDFGRASGMAVAFLPQAIPTRGLALALRGMQVVSRPEPRTLSSWTALARRIAAEREGGATGHEALAHALFTELLVEVVRHAGVAATDAPSGTVEAAIAFVEGSHQKPISLRDVARAVGKSPRHLATLVRSETARSVGEWITTFRVASARELLRGGDSSIEDVALAVGYSDVTHFIRTFRKTEGHTPAAFRRVTTRDLARGSPEPTRPPRASR